jgi:hypothetical protein
MHKYTGILQANLGRRSEAQLSLLNDETTRDLALLLVTEPNIFDIDGEAIVHQHMNWETVRPSQVGAERVARSFRSMIYVNKRCQFRQVEVPSSDIVAGILTLDTLTLMLASVYVPCTVDIPRVESKAQLQQRLNLVKAAWVEAKRRAGKDIQLFVGGDFKPPRPDVGRQRHRRVVSPRRGNANPGMDGGS